MLSLMSKYRLNSSILSIGANDKSVIILDSNYTLYELLDDEFIFVKKIFDFTPQHHFSKACAVSMQGFIAIGKPKSNLCEILYLKNGNLKHIKTLSWHKADIYNIRFSRDGKFLVTGGEDGKVFVFRLPDFHIVNILPPRPDYISNIHFGKISKLIVYSSYDLQNCVFDMEQNIIVGTFNTNSVVEDIVFFHNDKKIFCVCSNGESGIYDIENKSLDLKQNYNFWLTRTGLSKDDNYAYIGARGNILSYLHLDTNTPRFNVLLEYEDGVSFMRVINARLYIGYSNGYLQIFDLTKYENELQKAIDNNDYKNAKEISDKNISLKTHKIYIEFMKQCWENEFKKAKEMLQKDTSETTLNNVMNNIKVFFEDKDKKDEFSEFMSNIGVFKEFNEAVLTKDYVKAYKLIEENTMIKQTSEFEKLENIYNQTFEAAKKLLLNNSLESTNEANIILKPFLLVPSKKETINVLLRNANKFAQADLLLKNKHFVDYFKLAESFKEIKNTPNYKKAIIFGEQILATINELETKQNFNKALELTEILIKFVPFSKVALDKKNDINLKVEFLNLYNKKEYIKIYQSIQKYASLKGLLEYINLSNHFNKIFDDALNLAINGENKTAYNILKPYFNIPFWKNRIDSIFNLSYLNEIEINIDKLQENDKATQSNAKDENPINWKLTLETYIYMFGKNDELIKICSKNNEILDILNKLEVESKDIDYLPSIIIYDTL
ncbi:hypothetical protein CCY99_06450 [Helicobacter sp. 16-1353]|uniref:WD40 repeat domain-containing protein n=1 Tax=Helicobacter sp. 16-1353 TaxID=2004996 RepID=UPI000DCBF244|nr:WD40 repeat domain-containing protein [Helicobacter sp. 16-1353]RAX53005.1 hypothetical protein CCY99_06450 [Helicobacter sp. 16-1353]